VGVAYTISQIRVPVLKIADNVLQKFEISPNPIIVANQPFKAHIGVGLHSFARTNADIIFNQNYTINASLLRNASKVQNCATIFIPHYLVSIKPKEVSSSDCPFEVVVRGKTILYKRTQPLLQDYQLIQPNQYQLMFGFFFLFSHSVDFGELNVGYKILHGVDTQPSILPRNEHVASEDTNVPYC